MTQYLNKLVIVLQPTITDHNNTTFQENIFSFQHDSNIKMGIAKCRILNSGFATRKKIDLKHT